MTQAEAERYDYSDDPISVSEITARIKRLIPDENRKKLKTTDITEWLLSQGMLKVEEVNSKNCKLPTYDGAKLGLSLDRRESKSGERYFVTLYNRDAQRFILDHLTLPESK